MSKLWLLAAFAGGAVVGGLVVKLYIQGEFARKGSEAIDRLVPKDYAGPIKELWTGLVDDQFDVTGQTPKAGIQQ